MAAMRSVLVWVLLIAACGETRQVHRWPNHRRDKDAAIEKLQTQVGELEARVAELEKMLRATSRSGPAATPAAAPIP
jgi:outer membrane murein-binding lipoprotein Lpp